jgi:hypothetical protein
MKTKESQKNARIGYIVNAVLIVLIIILIIAIKTMKQA